MYSNSLLQWLIVVGGFISYFLADGCTYSAGIFFEEFKNVFQHNSVTTSVIPALVYAMPQFLSPFLCPVTDLVGYSTAAAWGAFFLCLSFLVTSFAQDIGLTYFSYGILMALGLQLTYTSAFMAVVSSFKDHKYFGLACGIMVCGGGIGAFATNHLVAWILSSWTWREALVIQGGIFLHAWISAALYYVVDENVVQEMEDAKYLDYINSHESRIGESADTLESRIFTYETGASTVEPHQNISRGARCSRGIKKLWFICPVFMILTPSRQRPRARKNEPCTPITLSTISRISNFCHQLGASLGQLLSKNVWKNGRFFFYVLANGLCAAGVVIPWTYVYALVRQSWLAGVSEEDLDPSVEKNLAWFPALIGLGSCFGQVVFGFVISKVNKRVAEQLESGSAPPLSVASGDVQQSVTSSKPVRQRFHYMSRLIYIFIFNMVLNGVTTLGFTYAPIPSAAVEAAATGENPGHMLILATNSGRVLAFACFALGITDGAFMTLLGPILEESLDEKQFPAGLGICLCITGIFNLAGTLIGGHMYDIFGSYKQACLLAAILPFSGILLITSFYCFVGGIRQSKCVTGPQTADQDV